MKPIPFATGVVESSRYSQFRILLKMLEQLDAFVKSERQHIEGAKAPALFVSSFMHKISLDLTGKG